jgi:hypothetical protein
MNANVDESQREDVDDNWLRPPIFLFYLLRDSPAGIDHNQQHRQLDNYANVTRHSSLPGLLPSDELLLADEGLVTTSIPIRIFNTTLSTLLVIVGGGEGDNDTSSSSDVMYNGSDYDGASGDNNLSDNYSSPYLMPWPQRTSWIAIFTLMLFVAIVGNTLVAWIVLGQSPIALLYSLVPYLVYRIYSTCTLAYLSYSTY